MSDTWRARWQTPTIGGIKIHPETSTISDGRIIAANSPPTANRPHIQSLGVSPKRLSLRGLLLGSDPDSDGDRLAAIALSGEATTYIASNGARRSVWLENIVRETQRLAGGALRVAIAMIEAASGEAPTIASDTAIAAKTAATNLIDTTTETEKLATSPIDEATERARVIAATLPPPLPAATALSNTPAVREAQILIRPAQNWANAADAANWTAAEQSALAMLIRAIESKSPGSIISSLIALVSEFAPPALATGAGLFARLLWRNKTKIYQQARRNALAGALVAAARHEPELRSAGEDARDSILAALKSESEAENDTTRIDYLAAARAAVIKRYGAVLPKLGDLIAYNPAESMPSIVAAHRYEGSTAGADLIARRAQATLPLFTQPPIYTTAPSFT